MNLKARFGKYKQKEADAFIASLKAEYNEKISALESKVANLEKENAAFKDEIKQFKEKEGVIAQVMLDATKRAKDIEDDYRKRAEESDTACRQLHDEWVAGMQSAAENLEKMRAEAKQMLENIDSEFNSLCAWAGERLESLEGATLPSGRGVKSLEQEISAGAGADLGELCKEMGLMADGTEETEADGTTEADVTDDISEAGDETEIEGEQAEITDAGVEIADAVSVEDESVEDGQTNANEE